MKELIPQPQRFFLVSDEAEHELTVENMSAISVGQWIID